MIEMTIVDLNYETETGIAAFDRFDSKCRALEITSEREHVVSGWIW